MNGLHDEPRALTTRTLAIDIGGSHLKAGILDPAGALQGERARVATPHPATPTAVVAALSELCRPLAAFDRISIGFPGFVRGEKVLTAPNLGTAHWSGFALSAALADALGKPARMLNDASVQGLGVIQGQGVELVLTLGTGMGFALFQHGVLAPHLEMSQNPVRRRKTYDEYIGHGALEAIGKRRWNKRIHRVISIFETVVRYDVLYLGGGNATLVTLPLQENVRVVDNEAGITGGVRLWDNRMDPVFAVEAHPFAVPALV
ncbi:MAG: ROK family protein [Acetobacteraceae bacterium]